LLAPIGGEALTVPVDLKPEVESIEHCNEAVEATRRLSVLDLMNNSGADARDQGKLVLPQP